MRRCAIFILLVIVGCGPKEQSSLNEPVERQKRCTVQKGDLLIYNTAAGFQLSRPLWMLNFALEDQFTSDCKLTNTKFSFAFVQGVLIPKPQHGLHDTKQQQLPQSHDELILMLTFQDPRTHGSGMPAWTCKSSNKIYKIPEFGVQMCGERPSPNIGTLPFYPRFEFIDSLNGNPSMTCPHQDIDGRTIADIRKLNVKRSCRGYWTWRPGVHAMFEIGSGKVLGKFRPAIEAADATLNSWVVTNHNKPTKP